MPIGFWTPYDLLVLPALLLAVFAQIRVRSTYAKYAKVSTRSGLTGAEAARRILGEVGIELAYGQSSSGDPRVCGLEIAPGDLTDHYDPRARVLRLSEAVFHGRSVSALGIAAHEVGHAMQHAFMYGPLMLRSVVYPVCDLGSRLAFPLFLFGLFVSPRLIHVAILLYSFAMFFTVLTLPVEFNASRRALRALANGGLLTEPELVGARKVLSAAALTYVAAMAMAALQLLRMIAIARDRD